MPWIFSTKKYNFLNFWNWMLNSNFNFKNHILPDFSITLEILENFGFVLCLFWLVNYERHWYLLSFTIVDKHFFFIWLFLGILALFLNLKTTGKIWFDINKNKFYHSKPTVSEKSLKLPLQSFLLLACSGKICLINSNSTFVSMIQCFNSSVEITDIYPASKIFREINL